MKTSILKLIVLALILGSCKAKDENSNIKTEAVKPVFSEEKKYDNSVLKESYNKLKSGQSLQKEEVEKFSSDLSTRVDFYNLLSKFNEVNVFPTAYNNFERAGESVLANWLAYPTELDTIPSQIQLVKKVDFAENDSIFIYYVYKFKTEPPHWSAKDGWMLGVVGPFLNNSKPYDWTNGTFSRMSKVNEMSCEKEVEWTHKNVFRRSVN